MALPCMAKGALAVRFCPLLFKLRPQGSGSGSEINNTHQGHGQQAIAAGAAGGAGMELSPSKESKDGVAGVSSGGGEAQQRQQEQQQQQDGGVVAEDGKPAAESPFQLPYRMVFAAATTDSVILYDTQVSSCALACSWYASSSSG